MFDLSGKGVVITGAASGIGLATALACARLGARLTLSDIEARSLERARAQVSEEALHPVAAVCCDVARIGQVNALADAAFAAGSVDLVLNNAGVGVKGPLAGMRQRDWHWVLGVNLWGAINGVEAFVPRLLAQGTGGHILFTASFAGLAHGVDLGAYAASKAGVIALADVLRQELRGEQIGVSVICPMRVETAIGSSTRNRVGGSGAADITDPRDTSVPGKIITAEEAAAHILDGVAHNDFYIMTHGDGRPFIAAKFSKIEKAYERQHPGSPAG